MKFTREFASHFSIEEYVHYLQCDLIEGAERLPLRVMVRYAADFEEMRRQKDHHEEQHNDLEKANNAMLEEISNLKDTMETLKKVYAEVDEALEHASDKIHSAKHMIQAVLI